MFENTNEKTTKLVKPRKKRVLVKYFEKYRARYSVLIFIFFTGVYMMVNPNATSKENIPLNDVALVSLLTYLITAIIMFLHFGYRMGVHDK